jgi:hypothetical protein
MIGTRGFAPLLEHLALGVLLEDGTSELFWHHELEELDARGA